MRLLLMTKDFPPDTGGIQTMCFMLAQEFTHHCSDIAVVAPKKSGYLEVDKSLPFPVYRIPSTPGSFPNLTYFHLPRIYREFNFDTVLAAQWQMAGSALARRKSLSNFPVYSIVSGREILTQHFSSWPFGSKIYSKLRTRAIKTVDSLFPISHYALELVQQAGMVYKSSTVIKPGCDPNRFHPVDGTEIIKKLDLKNKKVLLTTCRLVPRKGIDTVLQALPEIAASVQNVIYLVAGFGEDYERLVSMVQDLGITERVRFLGKVPEHELIQLYSISDLFVMPAREERPCVEGFGLVYLEANACGTPVIGSYSGGISDAVIDGKTGVLVPPSDPTALAKAVTGLLNDPEKMTKMGEAGIQHVLDHANWAKMAEQLYEAMNSSHQRENTNK